MNCLSHALVAKSRPARARGLKQLPNGFVMSANWSRPARARGLKQVNGLNTVMRRMSRPARARGLKQGSVRDNQAHKGRAPRGRVD